MSSPAKAEVGKGYQFGTFQGVFTPSILTILGVIMFLRFGWVLGNVGLPATLLIVSMASSITLLTGLSLSATATNMQVGRGGAYFVISRSLGAEVGAAIGLPLFFAQALGIAFYISGFSEAVVAAVDLSPWIERLPPLPLEITETRLVSVVTLLGLTLLAMISADLALKTQFLILALIVAALVSFFLGSAPSEALAEFGANIPARLGFWPVFAVFFPAVTGIEAGIAMSGDLKNPSRALPLGTLGAVVVGYLIYMTIPVVIDAQVADPDLLLVRPLIMADIARWGGLILAGVWAATLSSAMGAILGAPRTLQALAADRLLPRFIGRGYGKTNDPHNATVLSFFIALVALLIGDLNMIAPILTMFFLTSYGLINLSAGLEGLIESPSWRPAFRFPWWGSLLGAAACLKVMVMIDLGATITATVVTGAIYTLMKRRQLRAHWGDMRRGLLMLLVRVAIRRLRHRPPDERSWRPNILVFSGSPQSRWHLIELAQALAQGPSYLTIATIMPTEKWGSERVASLKKTIGQYLNRRGVEAMVKIYPSEDVFAGAEALIKGYGFGPLEPNTIVIGDSQREENLPAFTRLIVGAHRLNRNLVLVREPEAPPEEAELPERPRIDLWWRGGKQTNIGLMITLAYLLCRSERWTQSRVVLKRIIDDESERAENEKYLADFVVRQRLNMEIDVIAAEGRPFFEILRSSSEDAAMVFLGMKAPEEDAISDYLTYYRRVVLETDRIPLVLVLSADSVDFSEIIGVS